MKTTHYTGIKVDGRDVKLVSIASLLTAAVQHSGRSSMQPESPVPATPSSAQARTMRRNIRGETPLHIAAIKVGPSVIVITSELIQLHWPVHIVDSLTPVFVACSTNVGKQ